MCCGGDEGRVFFLTAKRANFLIVGGSCDNIDEGASPGKWSCLPLKEQKLNPRQDENWWPGKLQHKICSA